MLSDQKMKAFPLRSETKTSVRTLTTFIQYSIGITSCSNQIRKRNTKGIQIGKEEIKQSLLEDEMIPYVENPKEDTKNY